MNRSLKIVRVRLSHYDRIEEETSSFVGAMGAFYSKAREMLTPQATCLYISKPKGLLWHDYGVLFSCTRTFFFFCTSKWLWQEHPLKVKVLLLTPRNSSVTGEDCTSCLNLLDLLKSNNCDRQIVGSLPRPSALISNGICQTSCLAAKGSRKLN